MSFVFTPFPVLFTDRLVLREITLDDDNEVFYQRSDKSMNEYVGNPLCNSIEEAREWINKISANTVNGDGIFWGVNLKDDPKLMGGFCYWNLAPEERKAEIGFGIYPQHQGKGYMDEVLKVGLNYGFETMNLERIEAYTHQQNKKSIHLLEKNGFVLKEVQPLDEANYIVFEAYKN